ncbi:MAG: ribosome-associated translation inhibitor RaiA [Clostridia bacterium]|nr:ribosome-associated translation inhibitor RaiA [Clostridia bacterium]
MKFEIHAKNYEVTEKLKTVTDKKLSKLDKYFQGEGPSAKVTFKTQGNRFTTEITLDYNGKFVRAATTGDNFYDNIDVILPKIEGQIRKHRTRFDQHNKNAAYSEVAEFSGAKAEDGELVKKKRFTLSPMTVKEAEEELELLGHSFYVFLEAKTHTVQVLYKRNDGDLGLIETEV